MKKGDWVYFLFDNNSLYCFCILHVFMYIIWKCTNHEIILYVT